MSTPNPYIEIAGRRVGPDYPCYIIAELSANHGQDFDEAVRLIHAAAQTGADAIKLQTYRPDTITLDSDLPHFKIDGGTLWDGKKLFDLYGEAYTPWDWQPKLKEIANELGMDLFSSPFDDTAVDFLEAMDVPCHKIASFEMTHIPLLRKVASTGKPVIMSTGMATLGEIDESVRALRAAGCDELVLLKCTSAYPAPPEEANIRTIPHLAASFGVPAGLSDHTMGTAVPVAARALGACVVEKHFTMSREVEGPDSAFSLEPHEFAQMVQAVRTTEKALGEIVFEPTPKQVYSKKFRRSIFATRAIAAGEELTPENTAVLRPSDGLEPKHYDAVLGSRASQAIERGTPIHWHHIEAR